jgi:eukaryotic-like serine/threonine-protein kinase
MESLQHNWTKRLRRARTPFVLAPFAFVLVVLAAGCGAISSPQGWAAPVLTDSGTLVTIHRGKLALIDTSTAAGTTKWEFPSAADKNVKLQGVYSTPAVSGGTVVFGGYNGHVYGLNLADGKMLWDYNTGSSIVGGVGLDGGTAFIGNSDGQLLGLDVAKGGLMGTFKAGERIWSTPAVDSGTVYATSMDRKVYAFRTGDFTSKAAKPAPIWQSKAVDGAIAAAPAVTGGQVYVGSFDKHLYAFSQANANGAQVWRSPAADNWFWSSAYVSSGTVYVGSLDDFVYAFDTTSGNQKWRYKLSDSIRAQAVIAQGVLVAADRAGHLAGVDPATGQQKWSVDKSKVKELDTHILSDLIPSKDGNSVLVVTEGGNAGSQLLQIDPTNGNVTLLQKG